MNLADEFRATEIHRIRISAAELAAEGQSHESIVAFILQELRLLAAKSAAHAEAFRIADRATEAALARHRFLR
jgi:hypothetical protein